ncbi:UDP-galactose 4-epimerase [Desulfonauticus submarinus]|uniref:UDP-glucose 4-epimerase n=1 Tax=Desulfonauticus submarinus TaxID=206665 RepID=A0A1H0BFJ6_9BACT|nr:UDP-glucose 4-epimerase GalE [Desulfonauticus submarinus]SDN44355.1 UDP-galactose 4-epimerase [Desulfonauticus submarinus]
MILLVGGAGYIGSHVNKFLYEQGYSTVIFDNLIYGHKEFVKWGEFVLGDLNSLKQLELLFAKYEIDAVMHFAAFAYVGESVVDPEKYYLNNVYNTINLLNTMKKFGVDKFVFSSSCAVYGSPSFIPLSEKHPLIPVNPYGRSKLMVEEILEDYSKAYGLKYISLRYFNAAGADLDGEIGERHCPETHLIPLVLDVALGKKEYIEIYGDDYDTFDGTCIRDYIHVLDIARAHFLALEFLKKNNTSNVFNLGNGQGYSVKQVIDVACRVTGVKIKSKIGSRRDGDPPKLIANYEKAKAILNWSPKFTKLEDIVESAWRWQKKDVKFLK